MNKFRIDTRMEEGLYFDICMEASKKKVSKSELVRQICVQHYKKKGNIWIGSIIVVLLLIIATLSGTVMENKYFNQYITKESK